MKFTGKKLTCSSSNIILTRTFEYPGNEFWFFFSIWNRKLDEIFPLKNLYRLDTVHVSYTHNLCVHVFNFFSFSHSKEKNDPPISRWWFFVGTKIWSRLFFYIVMNFVPLLQMKIMVSVQTFHIRLVRFLSA